MRVKVSDYIAAFLRDQGIRHVFTIAGACDVHLLDSLRRLEGIEYVCNHHEQASAMAMYSYARATENLGACVVTSGPGGTNAITGVAAAWVDSIPCLVISGQVKKSDTIGGSRIRQRGIQEINIVDIVKPITKYAALVAEPMLIRQELEKAVWIARSGRPGPVWIDVTMDAQAALVDPSLLPFFTPCEESTEAKDSLSGATNSPLEVASVVWEMLRHAERPVLICGHGVRLSHGVAEFERLIELLGIPVLTTWSAIDLLPDQHPLNGGRPGIYGQRGANFCIQNSDLVLSVGSRLPVQVTGYDYSTFARAAKKVVVDIDPHELVKFDPPVDLPVCLDARHFMANMLITRPSDYRPDRYADWVGRCRMWKVRYEGYSKRTSTSGENIDVFEFFSALSDHLAEGEVIVPTASGSGYTTAHQTLRIKRGQRCFTSHNFAEMGFDIPGAIGACFAMNRRRVVTVTGDGGVQLNLQELQTIVHHNLPIKLFVLNNGGYLTIFHTQSSLFGECEQSGTGPASGVTLPSFSLLASTYGIPYLQLSESSDMDQVIAEVLNSDGPVLCEVMAKIRQPLVPKVSFRSMPDGSLISPPIEDLYPFLDRDEFLSNMIVPPVG